MHSSFPRIGIAALLLSTTATAQTYTSCNPLTEGKAENILAMILDQAES